MAFQLTISRRDLPPSEQLRRKPTLTIDGTMAVIGGPGTDCPLEGLTGTAATISRQFNGEYAVAASSDVQINGKACTETAVVLHSGDRLMVGDFVVQFHLCLPRARQSWRCAFLTMVAKGSVVVIFILIFGFMFVFTDALRACDRWDTYAMQNRLTQRLDEVRGWAKAAQKKQRGKQLDKLLMERVVEELDNCARYVRANEKYLTSEQTGEMMKNLDILESLMGRALGGWLFPDLPQPAIDSAVRTILNNSKVRN